jgi:hypothetical protein
MASDIKHPLINGKRVQHSDGQITIRSRIFIDFKSFSFKESLKPGKVRGSRKRVQGRTVGVYDADGSFEMYMGEAEELLKELCRDGQGYGEQEFDVVINYQARGMPMVTVELIGCRIMDLDTNHSEDENGIAHKFDLDIMKIKRNGLEMVSED